MCSLKVLEVLKQMEQAKYDPSIFYTSVQELLDHYPEFVFNEKVRGTTDVWHDLEKKVTPIYHKNSLNYNIVDLMPLIDIELEHLLRVRNLIRKILCVATAYRNKALFLQIIEHELKIELNTGGGISPAVRRVVIIYEKEGHVSAKKRKVPNNSENGDDASVTGQKKKEPKDPSGAWPSKNYPSFPKNKYKPMGGFPVNSLPMASLTSSLSDEDLLVLDAICNLKHVGAWEKEKEDRLTVPQLLLHQPIGVSSQTVKKEVDPEDEEGEDSSSYPYDKVYYSGKKAIAAVTAPASSAVMGSAVTGCDGSAKFISTLPSSGGVTLASLGGAGVSAAGVVPSVVPSAAGLIPSCVGT